MKKLIILLLLILCGCSKTITTSGNSLIENNTILFIRNKLSTSLLITTNNITNLLVLENDDKIYTNYIDKVNNLILLNNIIVDIDYNNKYILNNTKTIINKLIIYKTDKLLININNNNFCIYDKNISINGNYNNCDYIYILNNEKEVFINLNDNMKVLFYNDYVNFSNKFMEHLYTTWIDTYIINNNAITKLKINKNDYLVENINIET